MHVSLFKLSCICFVQVYKEVYAVTFENPISKLALIVASIFPLVPSSSIFLAVNKLANIFRVVR